MKLNKVFKLAIGAIFALPTSLFLGNEILANHLSERVEYDLYQGDLLAGCGGGGGGGGSSPAAKKAKKVKKAKAKVMFKKRKLSEAAAAGESTAALEAEIKALEAEIAENE